ncbi:MAG: hypothetical protein JNM24_09430 [Bdellovibrionaceae bacterium]|nr:hypothetical protein [Pseudobdellovibrionaceae bacterium]
MNKFDDEVAKIMRQGMPEEEHIHIAKHTESTYRWANQNLKAMRLWVIDLQILMDQPVGKVDVRGFYIGVHGIIGDMYRHFIGQVAFQKKLTGEKKIEI